MLACKKHQGSTQILGTKGPLLESPKSAEVPDPNEAGFRMGCCIRLPEVAHEWRTVYALVSSGLLHYVFVFFNNLIQRKALCGLRVCPVE